MTVTSLVVGATTPHTARIVAKITGASARLAVDTDDSFTDPAFFSPETPDADGVVHLEAEDLEPGTRYFYAVEVDSVLDTATTGRFLTHPPLNEPGADFTFWFATCAGNQGGGVGDILAPNRMSNHEVFETLHDRALAEGWLFGVHGGDLHYYDIGSGNHGISAAGNIEDYRRAYDDVLLQPHQHSLYRDLATVHVWDDHDFGPNNSDRTSPGRDNACLAYRERWPHYPLPAGAGANPIFQSFQIGRVLFIAVDVRADRDPNDAPAGPGKTMLGEDQRQWLEVTLTSSGAAFLVLLQPDQWTRTSGSDNWSNFTHERDQLADMLTDLGWADRMLMLQGDRHQVNMDSGANNAFGGFPVYELAPLDSGVSDGTNATSWDIGRHADLGGNQRGQYGVIRINDLGDTIEITGRSYINDQQMLAHTFTVSPEPPEPPDPPPEPGPGETLPVGTVKPVLQWLGCDLVSGRIIADLHDITGGISRLLGAHTSTSLTLPIPLSGRAAIRDLAFQATVPGRTMVVAVVNDQPAWGGLVLTRRGGTGGTLELACATLESYLTRRRVRDHTLNNTDQAVIAAGLAADAGTILGVGSGIGLEIDAPPTGTLRDREYKATDRATVYDRLRELSAVADGPEWTIEVLWGDDTRTWVRKVLRVRKRIGVQSDTPAAIFETTAASVFSTRGASDASYDYLEDYSGSRGANYVVAYGSGEGEDQPASFPAIAADLLATGFPIYERHWMPSSSITDNAVLDAHAERDLQLRRNGARTWEIEARWNVYPRMNVDWRLGDDVAWKLVGHRHPAGVTGQGRCIGWNLDPGGGTVQPILLDPSSDEGGE